MSPRALHTETQAYYQQYQPLILKQCCNDAELAPSVFEMNTM